MDRETRLPGSGPGTPSPSGLSATPFVSRHDAPLAALVLGLAAFNLTFRIGSEAVEQWDESLYAISAWEMVEGGNWIVPTFHRSVDYYNTKPPLNVWLIALSFKALGRGLVSLRLASVAAAWLTVAVLMWWSLRCFGRAVSLAAGLVLATTFAFLYVHAARSANTDAVFTLFVVLTVVVLWAARDRPWRLAWLGPSAAATFLLRGMGMLMPGAIALAAGLLQRRRPVTWRPLGLAVLLFLVPVAAWIVARWRVDEWAFLERLFFYDFVSRSFRVIEQHPGSPLFYVAVLMRRQYDWVLAALASWLLFPVWRLQVRRVATLWRDRDDLAVLMACWAGMTLLIPTVMATKVPWYLNSFYPVFAVGVAWMIMRGFSRAGSGDGARRRTWVLAVVVLAVFAVAEGRLIRYSYRHRNLRDSVQGLLMAQGWALRGRNVFNSHWNDGQLFVIGGILGARARLASGPEDFWRQSQPGDYLVSRLDYSHSDLVTAGAIRTHRLYYRPK